MNLIRKHKVIISILLALIILVVYAGMVFLNGRLVAIAEGSMYGKSVFSNKFSTDFTVNDSCPDGMAEVASSQEISLYVNTENGSFAVRNHSDNTVWYSNPVLNEGTAASGDVLNYLKSQLIVEYYDESNYVKSLNTFYDSVQQDGLEIVAINNGFRAEYNLGKPEYTMDMLPRVVEAEKFEELVLDKVSNEESLKKLNRRYKKKIVSELSEGSAKLILDEYPDIDVDKEYYILDLSTPDYDFQVLYEIIYSLSDYTQEDLIADNEAINYSFEIKELESIYIPLEVTVENGSLIVRIPCEEIGCPTYMNIKNIQVLPYFGAATKQDEGYMFIPDGSGALVYFNNGKITAPSYSVTVYGSDYSINANSGSNSPSALIPVFAEKKNNAGFWCVIEDGEAHAQINTVISDVSSEYNQVFSSFSILPVDFMEVESNDKVIVTNRYQQDSYKGDIKLAYRFTCADDSDYSDFAVSYRNYLIENGQLSLTAQSQIPFIVELVGKIECERNVFGIEYDSGAVMTTFSQGEEIVNELNEKGIGSPVIKFSSWFSGLTNNTASKNAKFDSAIGSKKDFTALQSTLSENGGQLFLNSGVFKQYGDMWDFNYSAYGARYTYNEPVKIGAINAATGELDEDAKAYHLLSTRYLSDYLNGLAKTLDKNNSKSIWFEDIAAMLSSDFTKNETIDRQVAVNQITEALSELENFSVGLDSPNMYAFKYADYACKIPMTSSQHILIDETIPFLSIVLSGCMPYTGSEFNLYGDVYGSVLKAAETGSGFYYKWMYESNTEICELEGYDARNLYSLNYSELIDNAAQYYSALEADLSAFIGKPIMSHEKLADNVYKTVYENGWVAVNYNAFDYDDGAVKIAANSYTVGG